MLPLRARDNLTKLLTPGMRSPLLTCWSGMAKRLLYCSNFANMPPLSSFLDLFYMYWCFPSLYTGTMSMLVTHKGKKRASDLLEVTERCDRSCGCWELIFCSFYFLILPITACFSQSIPLVSALTGRKWTIQNVTPKYTFLSNYPYQIDFNSEEF